MHLCDDRDARVTIDWNTLLSGYRCGRIFQGPREASFWSTLKALILTCTILVVTAHILGLRECLALLLLAASVFL